MTDHDLSLAARVHVQLAGEIAWRGDMRLDEQRVLFGIELTQSAADVTIMMMPDSTINVVMLEHGQSSNMTLTTSLHGIQQRVEAHAENEAGGGYDDDNSYRYIAGDGYRTFDREDAGFLVIENEVLQRRYELVGYDLESSWNNFARYHGYASWAEMRLLAPTGDREEDWTIAWSQPPRAVAILA